MTDLVVSAYKRGAAQHDMTGRFLGWPLHKVESDIATGLVKRLAKYASTRLNDAGFAHEGWRVEVETDNAEEPPRYRVYHVTFTNEKGGYITVQRIHTRAGWPFLDHGLSAGAA